MALPPFHKIKFRYLDAASDHRHLPEILDECYVDLDGILDRLQDPAVCIVHGPKGCGKTAVAVKHKQLAVDYHDWFVDVDDLETLPFANLRRLDGKQKAVKSSTFPIWQMLLSLRILEVMSEDEALRQGNPQLAKFMSALQTHGLLDDQSLVKLLELSAQKGATAKLKFALFETGVELGRGSSKKLKDAQGIYGAVSTLVKTLRPSGAKYMLFLDGLDYVLRYGRGQTEDLRELISAVVNVNYLFADVGLEARTILLIRDEVLASLPDPNLAKRVNDNGVRIDWKGATREVMQSELLEVVASRARLAGFTGTASNMWPIWFREESFPERNTSIEGPSSAALLLDQTRFLPRDIVKLFQCLQRIRAEIPFTRENVFSALVAYSDWFQSELNDAIVGLVVDEVREALPAVLQHLGRRFEPYQFRNTLEAWRLADRQEPAEILAILYQTSWIGQFHINERGYSRFSFKHRNRRSKFVRERSCAVHRGLWKSLGLT